MRGGQGELRQNELGRENMEARTDNQELTYKRAKIAYEQQDYE